MIPVYLAEMKIVKETDPEIYQEFQNGNWVVNKNAMVAFCAVGADNAPESLRWMDWHHAEPYCTHEVFFDCAWVSKVGSTSQADGRYFFQHID